MGKSKSKHKPAYELRSPWLRIVYEDRDIIVIDKQPGILSMAATPRQFSVKNVLDTYFSQRHLRCHSHVVHRLDRDTSGLMVYAKNMETALALRNNWKAHCLDRRYVALVEGRMEKESGTVESWLWEDSHYRTHSTPLHNIPSNEPWRQSMLWQEQRNVRGQAGKLAITHYRTLTPADDYSLVELTLETGRKNQIRVHMAELGHPVAGDLKYGSHTDPLHRLCLHAFRLHLLHPRTGQSLEFETPYPTAFVRK